MRRLIISLLLTLLGLAGNLFAAQTSTDSLFKAACEHAWNGERETARELCKQILTVSPTNKDAMLLIARTHAWDKDYRAAYQMNYRVLAGSPDNYDGLLLMADLETWRKNYAKALEWIEKGINAHPDKAAFPLRKAKVLLRTNRVEEARRAARKAQETDPKNEEVAEFLENLKREHKLNRITLEYRPVFFSKIYPANHLLSLIYGRQTRYGTILGRLNGRYRDGETGLQYELEAYPHLKDGMYLWVNFAYSQSELFPQYRSGLELFFSLPKGFEASVGGRHMMFRPSQVLILTASVGKYYKDYWFNARTYITPKERGVSTSIELIARKYFNHPQNHLSLRIGSGISPELVDRIDFGEENVLLQSHKMRLTFQHRITPSITVRVGAGVALRETVFSSARYLWEYTGEATLRYNF